MQYKCILIFVFFVTTDIFVFAEKNFLVEGKIGTLSAPATVFLFFDDPVTHRPVRDSIVLDNGKFLFKGIIEYPVYARMVYTFNGNLSYATAGDERKFYLEPGRRITINGFQLFNAEIKGSENQVLLEEYFEIVRPVQHEMIQVRKNLEDIYAPYTREYRLSMDSTYKVLEEEYNRLSMDFIKSHISSMVAVDMLMSKAATRYVNDSDSLEILYARLSEEMKNSTPGQYLEQKIQHRLRVGEGKVAPDFTVNTLQDKPVSLYDFKGKWLLLVFWSPTCDICHQEAQELKQMYDKYRNRGFEILAFAIEDAKNKHEWEKAVADLSLPYITASDLKGWDSPVAQTYKISGIPQNYLINPDGLVSSLDLFGYDLVNKLEKVLER